MVKSILLATIVLLLVFFAGCKKSVTEDSLPKVTTSAISSITSNSAVAGGSVTESGSSDVTNRGICFSSKPNPTVSDSSISSGAGLGDFSVKLSGIKPGGKYFVRAYASNTSGTAYGNQEIFTATNILAQPVDTVSAIYVTGMKTLYAFDGRNGSLLWKLIPENDVFCLYCSSPVYANGKVYICGDQKIYCYDSSGALVWATAYPSPFTTHMSPFVSNGLLIVNVKGSICAYTADTGTFVWKFLTLPGDPQYGPSIDEMVIRNGLLYVKSSSFIRALNPATGAVLWSFQMPPGDSGYTMAITVSRIYFLGSRLYVLDATTGVQQWEKARFPSSVRGVNLGNGKFYAMSEDINAGNAMDVYDSVNGNHLFRVSLGLYSPYQYFEYAAMPVLNDSVAYVSMSPISYTYAYNANTGVILLYARGNHPTVINKTLYTVSSYDDTYGNYRSAINCFDIATGQSKWESAVYEYLFSPPCIVTKSGKVYRLGELLE